MQKSSIRSTLVIVFGAPGSGKTTLSQQLAAHFSTIQTTKLIEIDAIEANIASQFSQQAWNESRSIAFNEFSHLNREDGIMYIIDDDFLLRSQRKAYYQVCSQNLMAYVEIYCYADKHTLQLRNIDRPPSKQLTTKVLEDCVNKLESESIHVDLQVRYKGQKLDLLCDQIQFCANQSAILFERLKEMQFEQNQQIKQNRESFVHQVDLQLRKLINIIMRSKSEIVLKENLEVLDIPFQPCLKDINKLNALRQLYLTILRGQQTNQIKGDLQISSLVSAQDIGLVSRAFIHDYQCI